MADPLSIQDDGFIPAAMRTARTRGRRVPESEHPFRTAFQRDRDRVIHSAHFRRLEYKTQVFVNGEGDNYRTRLTHTLEVTQIARSLARALHINEELAEAVALSHDLGHTPFGHAGERVLNRLMEDEGGFDHNAQGLRVVDVLEKRYAAFDGLNLSFEVREAFIRHGGKRIAEKQTEFPSNAAPLLEIAVTMLADDIAYIAHDIDDGLYSGVLSPESLGEQELWRRATDVEGFAGFPASLKRTEGVRRLINLMVTDALENTRVNLVRMNIDSPEKVESYREDVVIFSEEMEKNKSDLKKFLFVNFYRHPNLMKVLEEDQEMLAGLFAIYLHDPEKMPQEYRKIADILGIKRAVADYVAGMTDRFARDEWSRLGRK